jgi:DNA-binding beta-propeller fold protein YncE
MRARPRGRRSVRPHCEGLETRALLSSLAVMESRSRLLASAASTQVQLPSFLAQLPQTPTLSASTVPANGDLNPSGVAVIPRGYLVSNDNNSSDLQGTGSTIVFIGRDGTQSLFYQGPQGVGFSSALGVLRKGFVLVGNVPAANGTAATVQPGSLIILNRFGQQVAELSNQTFLNGPWGMTINDQGDRAQVFISNVLSGTVTRLNLEISGGKVQIKSAVQIASGYTTQASPATLELGPSGLAYNPKTHVLYVASTADNAIYAIPNADALTHDVGLGVLVTDDSTHLHGPVGLAFAPNGNLLVSNNDAVNFDATQPSEIDEYTPRGQFVNQLSISNVAGAASGLAVVTTDQGAILATVNDANNTLDIRRVFKPSALD